MTSGQDNTVRHLVVAPGRLLAGVRRQHDGLQLRLVGPPRQPLPQLLGHEGHERVQ